MNVSRRAERVDSAIREASTKASDLERTGTALLDLSIGDPVRYGFKTPTHVKSALKDAVDADANYYSQAEGLEVLREAIAERERIFNGAQFDSKDVIVTNGISEGLQFVIGATLNRGDEVLLPGPCYPPYMSYTRFFEGKPINYRTVEKDSWNPDLIDVQKKINKRTKLLVVLNPNNPTGAIYDSKCLSRIVDMAASHDLTLVSDEVYDRFVYDSTFTSLAALSKDVPLIGLNGFSKAHMMTGWRLGYVYFQDPGGVLTGIQEAVTKLSRLRLCPNTPVQMAGLAALRGSQVHVEGMVAELKKRRDLVWKSICNINGLSVSKPEGAFYIFPKIDDIALWGNDEKFVSELLERFGVVAVHGSGFDPMYGAGHFRLTFLAHERILEEAMRRLRQFMNQKTRT